MLKTVYLQIEWAIKENHWSHAFKNEKMQIRIHTHGLCNKAV